MSKASQDDENKENTRDEQILRDDLDLFQNDKVHELPTE